ncbi:MAG: hypothetical protein ACXAC7_08865 [Candidatus Hodarchaeales archaeon]|jgi:purine-cytosine permease-like protein
MTKRYNEKELTDTLGIDNIVIFESPYRSIPKILTITSFFSLLLAIIFRGDSSSLVERFFSFLFFIGGCTIVVGGLVDLGNLSPTVQSLTKKYGPGKKFETPNLNQSKSYYISGLILIFLSFIIALLR